MAVPYRRSIPPHARAAFGGKKRISKSFTSRVAGELWLSKVNDRIKALKVGGDLASVGVRKSTSFALAASGWVGQLEVKASTLAWYTQVLQRRLIPAFGDLKVSIIDKNALDRYKANRRQEINRFGKKTTDRSLKYELDVALSVIRWAKDANYLIDDSVFKVDKPEPVPEKIRRYDPEELERLREAASKGPAPSLVKKGRKHPAALARVAQRDLLVVEILSRAGLRVGELRAMRIGWIRWNERRIVIPHNQEYSPKGGKTRSVPIEARLLILLKGWVGDRSQGRLIEPQRRGRPRGKTSFRGIGVDVDKVMTRLSKSSGIKITAHDLRHHAISRWVELMTAGRWSLVDIQKWAGHESIRTTQLYLHEASNRWRSHADALDRAVLGEELAYGAESPAAKDTRETAMEAGLSESSDTSGDVIGNACPSCGKSL